MLPSTLSVIVFSMKHENTSVLFWSLPSNAQHQLIKSKKSIMPAESQGELLVFGRHVHSKIISCVFHLYMNHVNYLENQVCNHRNF